MVKKYEYGQPFETYAVVEKETIIEAPEKEKDGFFRPVPMEEGLAPYGGITWDRPQQADMPAMVYRSRMEPSDVVYGLGENVRGINKRGWIYEGKCSDDPNHTESKRSLYGAHNFLILAGKNPCGIFVDYPGRILFDVGYLDKNELNIVVCSDSFTAYVITPEVSQDTAAVQGEYTRCLYSVLRQFRHMIGQSYIPPYWAFGFQQSRWSYATAKEVEEVVDNYRGRHIPLDAVYLDIDYMERYKDFTVEGGRFPDFENFVRKMKEKHIHLVPIIDAGVKIEEGYPTYEEGVKEGYFCKEADGSDFVAGVWPGRVHFPDVLNEKAAEWFGNGYKPLIEKGIDGFWNDMNEPAIFYSEKHLREVFDETEKYRTQNLDIQSFFKFKGTVEGLANNTEDYERFYHRATQPDGETLVRHDHVHNLYGFNMTKAAALAFRKMAPDREFLLFSRASYIGMHRYGGIWTGDNHSWWSHILLTVKMLPSLNMCGFLYVGSDIGGFNDNATEELMMRWIELGIFVPLMRNHAAAGTRPQELYRFTDTESFRRLLEIRYALIPYLYDAFIKAAKEETLMYKPLGWEYPEDKYAVQAEDQLYVGDSIMICPVYTQNAVGRYVYLPEPMTMVRLRSIEERELIFYERGHHFVDIEPEQVVFFIKRGHTVAFYEKAEYTQQLKGAEYALLGHPEDIKRYLQKNEN